MDIRAYSGQEQTVVLEVLLPLEEVMLHQRLGKEDLEFQLWTSWVTAIGPWVKRVTPA